MYRYEIPLPGDQASTTLKRLVVYRSIRRSVVAQDSCSWDQNPLQRPEYQQVSPSTSDSVVEHMYRRNIDRSTFSFDSVSTWYKARFIMFWRKFRTTRGVGLVSVFGNKLFHRCNPIGFKLNIHRVSCATIRNSHAQCFQVKEHHNLYPIEIIGAKYQLKIYMCLDSYSGHKRDRKSVV